jgi:hypothetical protein
MGIIMYPTELLEKHKCKAYQLANNLACISVATKDPLAYNRTLKDVLHDVFSDYIPPSFPLKAIAFLYIRIQHLKKALTIREHNSILLDFEFYSAAMFVMKIIDIEKNLHLKKLIKYAYNLNDDQTEKFIDLVIKHYTKVMYRDHLYQGYLESKTNGNGVPVSSMGYYQDGQMQSQLLGQYIDYNYGKLPFIYGNLFNQLKSDFKQGIEVRINGKAIGKVHHVVRRLAGIIAFIDLYDEYKDYLHRPDITDKYEIVPLIEYRELEKPIPQLDEEEYPVIIAFNMFEI